MSNFILILSLLLFLIGLFYALKNKSWVFLSLSLCTGMGLGLYMMSPHLLFSHSMVLIISGISSFLLLSLFYPENNRLKWTRIALLMLALAPFLFKMVQWTYAHILLWSFIPCALLFAFLFLERRKIDEQPFYELGLCLMIFGFWLIQS